MLKRCISVNIAKMAGFVTRVLNIGSGTSMPGVVATKLMPDVLNKLMSEIKQEKIVVTGTNGKTTTSNFIASILQHNGRKVAHNAKGANMPAGVITAMLEAANFLGNVNSDNAVIEADEAYLKQFPKYFSADYLLVTNLFRDQLDRYGELDTTAKMIKTAIEGFKKVNPDFKTVLNADDPSIQSLSDENSIFFGFDDVEFEEGHTLTQPEIATCSCGLDYQFDKVYYGHIGHYYCSCGNKRPTPLYNATAKIFTDKSIISIVIDGQIQDIIINLPGIYNAYNALGAIVIALQTGMNLENIRKAFASYSTVFGRAEKRVIRGKNVIVQLIKNPVGAGEVIQTVNDNQNSRVLMIINDNYADGRDVSWLWDTNFEILKNHKNKIIVSGIRAADMALRLKYAGINQENITIENDMKKAIDESLSATQDTETLYIMPTYTALLKMQKMKL